VKLPFDRTDIKETIKSFLPVAYRKPFKLKKTEVIYFDAGHVPGSAMTHLKLGNKSILYTSDYNSIETRLMKEADLDLPKVDILITESTYSQREHPDRKIQEKLLLEIIHDTLANDAVCLISGFAIGRLQEVLLALGKQGIDYPLYMDGMARKATTIINQHKNLLKEPNELDDALKKVQYVNSERQRKKIIKQPCVILTTSGMLTGGAVVWYLKRLYEDRNASLVLTGFQLEHTPGKTLLETGRYIAKGLNLEVKMFVKRLDFSAHVGRSGLFALAKKLNPEKIFCVHGDYTEEFADELKQKGFDATAPVANNRIFDV
jgi:putative mRNA 3-end processing factor